jgi:selenophosphate synthase
MQSALFDPQTAGGLLISLDAAKVDEFLERVSNSRKIGYVTEKTGVLIRVQ